jgi:hypothetical protein
LDWIAIRVEDKVNVTGPEQLVSEHLDRVRREVSVDLIDHHAKGFTVGITVPLTLKLASSHTHKQFQKFKPVNIVFLLICHFKAPVFVVGPGSYELRICNALGQRLGVN